MGLRARLNVLKPETVQEFELAIEERYFESLEFLTGGYFQSGIYILGYAAEMILKNAFFRFDGARLGEPIGPRLGPARRLGRDLLEGIQDESYHSIRFWAALLQERRIRVSRPLPDDLGVELARRTNRLYATWWVEMRYRSSIADEKEANHAFEDVSWLFEHYQELWR
jgi:hypothetical protein